MRRILFLILLYVCEFNSQPCEDKNSIDISDGILKDGKIFKNGLAFPPKYVYKKNFNGVNETRGCVCDVKNCLRKCCPMGSVIYGRNCTQMTDKDIIMNEGLDMFFMNAFQRRIKFDKFEDLFLVYGRPCKSVYKEDDGPWFVQKDGKLFVELTTNIPPWTVLSPDKYCIDTFFYEDGDGNTKTRLDALACFADETPSNHFEVRSSCMLISCVFIIATVAVYAWLPELRNMHGRVLMAYLLCLFFGFLFMASMQIMLTVDNISAVTCVILTIIIYYFLQTAFFWLNVMSFDIWWTFSGKSGMGMSKVSKRFCIYSMYAFGVPALFTIILASLEFSGLPPHPFLPLLRYQGCFLFGRSKLLYLYGPMFILCVANIVFFVMTAVKIAQIKQQTAVLKSKESAMHDQHRKDKQRLLLYLKLFTVMGINWILEVVSALYPDAEYIWMFTDAYNLLIGVTVFFIFVCKRKIFHLIKKRAKGKLSRSDCREFSYRTTIPKRITYLKEPQKGSTETIKTVIDDNTIEVKTTKL
ncbi:PREDICTED: G-protein coupled receptor Mth2-like isoform X3 [Papilio polytes]|uniref:G-protein coupled receptor Mth2-like isoform X3 n=1 Tax=Papilio polytes TaxID=76194 RepID=UPI0006764805|nr:PREDICTED: G-protein coupled receptor Mth2-like isoform X3 [Papilio polytes]